MADEGRSIPTYTRFGFDAALAAIHTYRAIYGNTVRSDFEPFMAALRQFWLDRFREGYPSPFGWEPAPDKKAPDPGKDTATAPGPHEAVEKDGR